MINVFFFVFFSQCCYLKCRMGKYECVSRYIIKFPGMSAQGNRVWAIFFLCQFSSAIFFATLCHVNPPFKHPPRPIANYRTRAQPRARRGGAYVDAFQTSLHIWEINIFPVLEGICCKCWCCFFLLILKTKLCDFGPLWGLCPPV